MYTHFNAHSLIWINFYALSLNSSTSNDSIEKTRTLLREKEAIFTFHSHSHLICWNRTSSTRMKIVGEKMSLLNRMIDSPENFSSRILPMADPFTDFSVFVYALQHVDVAWHWLSSSFPCRYNRTPFFRNWWLATFYQLMSAFAFARVTLQYVIWYRR